MLLLSLSSITLYPLSREQGDIIIIISYAHLYHKKTVLLLSVATVLYSAATTNTWSQRTRADAHHRYHNCRTPLMCRLTEVEEFF